MLSQAPASDPKLSATPSINFRPGESIYNALTTLSDQTGRKISDILRDFITAYWPECDALNRNLARNASPADARTVRQWIDACSAAAALGQDPATILREATERDLAASITAQP